VPHGRGEKVDGLGREHLLDRQRVAGERPAFLRRDLADRAQRRAEAAAREGLVHLRHFERGELHRAEERGRKRAQRSLDAEAPHGVEHALDADLGA
jgi:hypothetical protein